MKTPKRKLGDWGESQAVRFLKKRGYGIVERNWSTRWGEIDIIAFKDGRYIFFEVKTSLTPSEHGFLPERNVGSRKVKSLHRTIEVFLSQHDVPLDSEWQLDVITISILKDNNKAMVKHFENPVFGM